MEQAEKKAAAPDDEVKKDDVSSEQPKESTKTNKKLGFHAKVGFRYDAPKSRFTFSAANSGNNVSRRAAHRGE